MWNKILSCKYMTKRVHTIVVTFQSQFLFDNTGLYRTSVCSSGYGNKYGSKRNTESHKIIVKKEKDDNMEAEQSGRTIPRKQGALSLIRSRDTGITQNNGKCGPD